MCDMNDQSEPDPIATDLVPEQTAEMRVIDAETLFASDREVFIRNGKDLYRLRRTRHGKLLLNK